MSVRKRALPNVYLHPPTVDDRAEFLELVAQSRKLHHVWLRPPSSRAAFDSYVARCSQEDFVGLLVRSVEGDALVGVFNISQIFYGAFHSAYLGYYAFEHSCGQGYMSSGLQLTLRHAFTDLHLHRVEANLQPENRASRNLVKRAGFRQEGLSPRYLKIGGRWRDHERWAILREEWQALKRAKPRR